METKKKFNKKKLLTFGILGVFALALASAALVSYLSNPVDVSMDVESPLVLTLSSSSDGVAVDGDVVTANIYGADTFSVDASLENKANNPITGFVTEVKIHNDGISADDLNLVYSGYGLPEGQSVTIPLCQVSGEPNNVYAYIGSPSSEGDSINAGETQSSTLTATMNQFAIGTYTGTVQVIDMANRKC